MEQTPYLSQVNPSYWIYTVYNPLYGYTCSIRDKVINGAIKEKATLAVRLQVSKGLWVEEVVNPRKWKKEGKAITMYSKYNSPMTMYQRELVTDSEPVPIEELTKVHVDTTPLREEELWI